MQSKKDHLKAVPTKNREDVNATTSSKKGIGGFFETLLRKFKNLAYITLVLPLYVVGALFMGTAAAPGLWVFQQMQEIGAHYSPPINYLLGGIGIVCGFFTYGFSLIFLMPLLNLVVGAKLKPWRGQYYSLEAIRWFLHNSFLYTVRYTFLEFITPTPFNILFFKMMGMKIGRGTAINSTWISDPSLITMGNKVTVGGSAVIVGHYGQAGFLVLAPVTIGDNATIGLRATIMGGVTIGENAKILPNSVVLPKTVIPAGETWGGVPAVRLDK